MAIDDTGAAGEDLRHMTAEMIQYLAAKRGVDLTGTCPGMIGFLVALGATMARANELSEPDRALHAESTFELMRVFGDEDNADFAAGWNLGIDAQMIVMQAHADAENGLSAAGLEILKHSSAALSRTLPGRAPA